MTYGTCVDHFNCLFCYRHPSTQIRDWPRTRTLLFCPLTTPSKFAMGSMMRSMYSGLHVSLQDGPAHQSRPRLGHIHLVPDREALRASAHSLCRQLLLSLIANYYFAHELLASPIPSQHHTDPNTKPEAVALKDLVTTTVLVTSQAHHG